MTPIVRIVHNAAVSLLAASAGFMVAAFVAHHTGFESWQDGLLATYLWNFTLAFSLYGLLAVLLAGQGVVRLIGATAMIEWAVGLGLVLAYGGGLGLLVWSGASTWEREIKFLLFMIVAMVVYFVAHDIWQWRKNRKPK